MDKRLNKFPYFGCDNRSGANDRYGAGIYGPRNDHKESIHLGKLATVFQAEVLAIHRCAETLLTRADANYRYHICSDSRAVLDALCKTATESVVWDCMRVLNRLGKSHELILMWVPGHQGIPGSEIEDRLAGLGTHMDPDTLIVGVPFATGKNISRGWLEKEHSNSWKQISGCKWSKQLMESPQHNRMSELLVMNRSRLRLGIGLLTGHVALRSHLHKLSLTESKACRLCREESENNSHILCRKRYRL